MRVLVTGKNSFIGKAFAVHAAERGDMAVDAVSVRGDDWKDIDLSVYDAIVHAAGIAHVSYNDDMRDEYMAVNRDLTLDIARRAKAAGVRQFVFLSSIIVYGPAASAGNTRIIKKNTPPSPENAYGQSKLEAEQGLKKLADVDFRVAILRLPTVYGEGSRGNYALVKKYADYLPVFPGVSGERSMIYVENLAEFICQTVEKCTDGMFFPEDGERVTTASMLRAIRVARGKKLRTVRLFDFMIKLAGNMGVMRRIFGGLAYDKGIMKYDGDYRLYTLEEAMQRIENGR